MNMFVLETICTGTMRVIHIPVKTEETQRLRIKFVLYCPICAECSNSFVRDSQSVHVLQAFSFGIQASPKKCVKGRSQ